VDSHNFAILVHLHYFIILSIDNVSDKHIVLIIASLYKANAILAMDSVGKEKTIRHDISEKSSMTISLEKSYFTKEAYRKIR